MNIDPGMVQVDGKSYCSGLFWYPLDGGPRNAAQLEGILAEQNAAFYVTRGHPPTQVGLLDAEALAQRGALSIAACVADRLTREGLRSFLVAFPTDAPGQWCYVAQNQELIQFDGDLAGSATEVRERMQAHLSAGVDWDLVIAPAEWDVVGAVQRERSEMLPTGRSFSASTEPRLRAVQRRNAAGTTEGLGVGAILCVLALMAEGAAGYWVWRDAGQKLEARQAAASAEQQQFVAQRPWFGKPDFAQWAPLCAQAVARHAMTIAGWDVTRIACDPAAARLTVEWVRGPGALFDQLVRLQPSARLSGNPKEPASASAQFPLQPATSLRHLPYAPSDLMRRGDWQRAASRWAEQWRDQRPSFTAAAPGAAVGGSIPWALVGGMPPTSLLQTLTLPGSVLTGIEFNPTNGNAVWTVKATHYVQD